MTKRFFTPLLLGLLLLPAVVRADESLQALDKLYQSALREHQQAEADNQQREKRFMAARDKQRAQLQEAEKALAQERQREERLKAAFAAEKTKLAQLHDQLDRRSASLSTFFGSVRQVAGESAGMLHESVISAQYPGRDQLSDKLADDRRLPSVQEVEQLWRALQQEIDESGKVVQFSAPVAVSSKRQKEMTVTRVGAFDVLADGAYLDYAPDEYKLTLLGSADSRVAALEKAQGGYHRIGIDPSAGTNLRVIMQARDFAATIAEGRAVGLLSLGLGLAGLLMPIRIARVRLASSILGAGLFSFGIVILMTSMLNVFFGEMAQPVSYAQMEIVRQDSKKLIEAVKQESLPEKPRPEILPLPQQLTLQRANLLPSVPSLTSLPKLSTNVSLTGGPMLGGLAPAAKVALDDEVIPLVQIPPIMPARAQRLHIHGTVVVGFTINELGGVERPTILKAEPEKLFDQAAIQAILRWRFKPKMEDGKPVARVAHYRFDFNPQD